MIPTNLSADVYILKATHLNNFIYIIILPKELFNNILQDNPLKSK